MQRASVRGSIRLRFGTIRWGIDCILTILSRFIPCGDSSMHQQFLIAVIEGEESMKASVQLELIEIKCLCKSQECRESHAMAQSLSWSVASSSARAL